MSETTGEKIRRIRKDKGMSMDDLAQKIGCSKSTIHFWETGEIGSMGIDKLRDVARALGVTPEYLLGWDEPKHPDDELKFALFGGESATDEELEEVRQFVEFVKSRRKNK